MFYINFKNPHIMKKLLLLFAVCITAVSAAQNNFWQLTKSLDSRVSLQSRRTMPSDFQLHNLQLNAIQEHLSAVQRALNTTVDLDFPLANGSTETFRVKEHSVFQDGLQAAHPNLRAYKGVSTNDASTVIHFSISPQKGLSAMVSSGRFPTYYIDSYTKNNGTYITYQKNSLSGIDSEFECEVFEPEGYVAPDLSNVLQQRNANDSKLRTYRLALACTGEYSQYHLDQAGIPITDVLTPIAEKKAIVLEEMMISMVRVNGVYEKDFSIRMVIVDSNEDIIFINGAADPYVNEDGVSMLATNQGVCDGAIGPLNYDIGHVYSTGGGGVAFLGVPCSLQKAGGVTGSPVPTTDTFWIDYVAHEMGHQFGANHTQNNSCQRNGSTAMEPGSASTIMGYAGICAPNVQNNSDDHFHAISIQEIWAYVNTQDCEVKTDTGNEPPTVEAPEDFTTPASTPFRLDAVGNDIDSAPSALTYNWEQIDEEVGVMPPAPTNEVGPMFRSNSSISSPTRFMPDMPTVLAGLSANEWEVVPSVNRTMEFRVTLRDNALNGGASASDDVIVTIDETSGPFIITSQNTATAWEPNSVQTVTWDVANTNIAPMNTSTVNVLFSDDGGQTFAETLASNVANNGTVDITVPSTATNTGRVKVVPVGNYYYDINDADISINSVLEVAKSIAFSDLSLHPNPTKGIVTLSFTPKSQENIKISLFDVSGRQIENKLFENKGSFTTQLNYSHITSGIYFVKIAVGNESSTMKLLIQ
jgi:predicted Zn-dependent protease